MNRILISAVCVGALVCTGVQAAPLEDCGDLNRVTLVPDPIAENSRSFLSGKVRVTTVDTGGEPVCCSAHALIEVVNEEGAGECFILSGYVWVYSDRAVLIEAEGKTQHLFVPVQYYPHGEGAPNYNIEMIHLEVEFEPPAVRRVEQVP
jgi:hypothetical protein